MKAPTTGQYLFDNSTPEAARQVLLLGEILDPHTRDVLLRADVQPGWRCLDLGAGAGTVATWLADAVSPTGHVTALDKDPRHIRTHQLVSARSADITTTDLGANTYDLIHARLLFMHLPQREDLLQRAIAALKPGGQLIISDWDCTRVDEMLVDASAEIRRLFLAFQNALIALGVARGMSSRWARDVPRTMRRAGLVDIRAEVYNRLWAGGEAGCLLHACNSRQLEQPLLKHGMSAADLDVLRAAMDDPSLLAFSYPMVTTIGVRSADD